MYPSGHTEHPPAHVRILLQVLETSLYEYPAIQLVHFAGLMVEQVEHGSWQFWLHVWAEVKKYPSIQAEHPVAVQVLQLIEHWTQEVPER